MVADLPGLPARQPLAAASLRAALPRHPAGTWGRLRRPLHLPRLAGGQECAVSSGRPARAYSSTFGSASALGTGPAYPVVDVVEGRVRERPTSVPGTARFVFKALWIISPNYRGPVLVRGDRIDAPGEMTFRFNRPTATAEMRIPAAPRHYASWRSAPSNTVVSGHGCFAYQIDGTSFSTVVTVRTSPAH
jgi:hypothetical protein